MTKKDYKRAATIAQTCVPFMIGGEEVDDYIDRHSHETVVDAFVKLFRDDNPRFDEARFRAACQPGANMKARPRKGSKSNG